jgi:predicted amino acid racemase
MIQLCLYKQLIEIKFNVKIPFISGGSSVNIALIKQGTLPKDINHLRIGETLFMGTDAYNNIPFESMENNIFKLHAEIIELYEKPLIPSGEMGSNLEGDVITFDDENIGKSSIRAIIDVGLLDIDMKHLESTVENVKLAGATSDMVVLDLGENLENFKVGDEMEFTLDYMGIVRIMNSQYIEKRVVH